jgi:hypothetical protein
MRSLNCQQCGGSMVKKNKSSGNCLGLCIALAVIGLGIVLCLTGIGAIIGIPLIIGGLFIGGKRSKVWQCKQCAYVIPRG